MHSLRRLIPLTLPAVLLLGYGAAKAQDDGDEIVDDQEDTAPPEEGDDTGAEAPADTPAAGSGDIDVDALRQEYLKLRDRLFRSRARAAAVASAIYSSRVSVNLDYGSGRFYSIGRATIRLDGANIYDDTAGAIAQNKAPRFDGYIAPGRHVLSFRIEATGKDDERFTSAIENTIVIQAPAGKDLVVTAKAKDGGDIPYNWKKKERGSYKLHLDIDVKSVKRGAKSDGRVQRATN